MTHKTRIVIFATIGGFALFLVVKGLWVHPRTQQASIGTEIESLGRPLIRAYSLSNFVELKSFRATVQSKRIDSNSFTVYLKTPGAKELAIHTEHPSTNDIAVLSSLKIGMECRFPEALKIAPH